jgi:hypothetical protein
MRGVARQKIEIESAVIGGVKDRLAIVSTLRNVVRDARENYTGAAGHTQEEVGNTPESSQENASVPILTILNGRAPLQ